MEIKKINANNQNLKNADIVHVSDMKYVCIDTRTNRIYDAVVHKDGNYYYLLNTDTNEISDEPEDFVYITSMEVK